MLRGGVPTMQSWSCTDGDGRPRLRSDRRDDESGAGEDEDPPQGAPGRRTGALARPAPGRSVPLTPSHGPPASRQGVRESRPGRWWSSTPSAIIRRQARSTSGASATLALPDTMPSIWPGSTSMKIPSASAVSSPS